MQKSDSWTLALVLLVVLAVLGGVPFLMGGFYVAKHEGDTLQLAEMVLRMARGEWPHLDFMTPIGVLAMAPIAFFVKQGWGIGHAIFLAQLSVGLILWPATVWVVQSRLHDRANKWICWGYGAYVMAMCVALVHGEADASISISMHYNRWAWAITYLIVPLVMLTPTVRPRPALDGALIGFGLAALVLIKVTYFVSVAPAVALGLVLRREWAALGATLVAGLAVAGLVTALAGFDFWLAYYNDLHTVAFSSARPQPGESFTSVASSPAYIGASFALMATIVMLRQGGRKVEGLLLLVLAPGLVYIVFQNYGNDPQWLVMLATFAFVLRADYGVINGLGWDLRHGMTLVAGAALAFGFPSAVNLVYSPIRHLAADTARTVPLVAGYRQHWDLFSKANRMYGLNEEVAGDGPDTPFSQYAKFANRQDESYLNGEKLPHCEQHSGLVGYFTTVSKMLADQGLAGKHLIAADLFGFFWLYGPFEPTHGAAPWYYGGLSGIDNADYIVVPLCPTSTRSRSAMLKELKSEGYKLTEVSRNAAYILITARKPG